MASKPQVIALEEHYLDPEVKQHIGGRDRTGGAGRRARLDDVGAGAHRARWTRPASTSRSCRTALRGRRRLDAELAVPAGARRQRPAAETVQRPSRPLRRLRVLPTADPKAAADELERAVTKLGFKGAMVHGLTGGAVSRRQAVLADLRAGAGARRAALHAPGDPAPGGRSRPITRTMSTSIPNLLRAAWGFTVETATQGIRLVLSGVFDAYPRLKIILGHMGEGLPFLSVAHQHGLARDGAGKTWFRDIFCEHFWITTSGFFSDPALLCCIMEMGIDRILFSVDYPFVENPPGTEWMQTAAALRRGQGEDPERQRQAAFEAEISRMRVGSATL